MPDQNSSAASDNATIESLVERTRRSRTPSLVYAMPGPALVMANQAYRDMVAPRLELDRHPDWPRALRQVSKAVADGMPAEVELEMPEEPLRLHISPLPSAGALVWLDGPGLAADEVRHTAHAALAAKSRFLAAASHDLRQPFQAMRFFHSVLSDQVREQLPRRTLDMLGKALSSGEQLLNALLDISALDAGTVKVEVGRVALAPLMDQLVAEFEPLARAKGISLRVHVRPLEVETDPVLLERILRNLLANAVTYTRRGGVLLAARPSRGRALIEVWDTGFGIPADQLNAIFEEFHQLENPERDRSRGLGLGLAIVRRLSQLLDLPLDVRSQLGRGSRFSVRVPLAAPMAAAEPASSAPHPELVDPLAARTILVVDDDAMVLMGLQMMLETWGVTVVAAEDMGGVLRGLDHTVPDLVLSDLRLRGGLSGFEVVERVRALLRRKVPAIILTGETGQAELAEGARRDVAFLHKPIQAEPLRRAIAGALEN